MKKILCLIGGIFFFIGCCLGVEVKDITGPTSVLSGDKQTYKVTFTEKLTVATQFIVSIEKDAGLFDNGSSTYNAIISSGKSEIELTIAWSASASGKIVITGGREGGLAKTLSVNITKTSSSLPISGANIILENIIETYQVPNEKYHSPLEWIIDSNYLDIISGQGTYKIQVKGKKYTDKTTISVKSKTLGGTINIDSKEIKISPNFAITPLEKLLCSESEVNYSVTFPTGASVVWTAVDKLSYISGQGTATAKFKTSGNGKAKVKAIITYSGKTYNLENSEVWVGVPPQVTLSGAVADGGELRAGGTYSWGYHRLNDYSFTPISYSRNGVEYANKPVITFTVPTNATYFSIGLKIKNICGWSNETWARYMVTTT